MYKSVLDELEGTPELDNELALFNKVGDLYLKLGNTAAAVDTYDRAVNKYAEVGFANNAIALCNKILRNAPGRTPVYFKLAKLMYERGFVAEAKKNLIEYADRMQKAGQLHEAFQALKNFADMSPESEDIRLLLAEQLKKADLTDEAREQLAKVYAEVESGGDQRRTRATLDRMQAIDPDFDVEAAPKPKVAEKKAKAGELVFLTFDDEQPGEPSVPAAVEEPPPALEIEPTALVEEEPAAAADTGFIIEPTSLVEEELAPAGGGLDIEPTSFVEEAPAEEAVVEEAPLVEEAPVEEEPLELETAAAAEDLALEPAGRDSGAAGGIDLSDLQVDEVESAEPAGLDLGGIDLEEPVEAPASTAAGSGAFEVPEIDLGGFDVEVGSEAGTGVLDLEEPAPTPPARDARPLVEQIADDPENPSLHRSLAEQLIEQGERDRGFEEFDLAMRLAEEAERWSEAEDILSEILRLDPGSVRHHQKRVEFAFRRGDKARLADAYLALADALFRDGAVERARKVYERVLETDPDNEQAKLQLSTFEPEAAAPAAPAAAPVGGGDFVDLGAMILDEEPVLKDTRMRIEEEEPTGDEERDFSAMLSQFKRGIEENVADEDWQAHYDLGVAFKEMGLLDEAIAEFQKALRSPEGRLKTTEALGLCFFEKGQYSVAATVMRRAVEGEVGGDDAKIGLLYWLGRCQEEQQRPAEALACYQRVFAIDIAFEDVQERVKELAGAGS